MRIENICCGEEKCRLNFGEVDKLMSHLPPNSPTPPPTKKKKKKKKVSLFQAEEINMSLKAHAYSHIMHEKLRLKVKTMVQTCDIKSGVLRACLTT